MSPKILWFKFSVEKKPKFKLSKQMGGSNDKQFQFWQTLGLLNIDAHLREHPRCLARPYLVLDSRILKIFRLIFAISINPELNFKICFIGWEGRVNLRQNLFIKKMEKQLICELFFRPTMQS